MKKTILYILVSLLIFAFFASSIIVRAEETTTDSDFSHFTSQSYILIEPTSHTVLTSYNENDKYEVASIVKLMTLLLTFEAIDGGKLSLDDTVYPSEYACIMEGSQAFLDAGSEYSVRDLIKTVIVASANDSAVVLAETVSGSESQFVKLMNQRAQELNMANTLYANATGLPAENQYSTAADTSTILYQISKHSLFEEDSHIWMDKLVHPSGRETELVNTNRLIRYFNNCKGGKTGYTDEARYCLGSISEKDGFELIAVVLGCKKASDRFNESMDLYRYGFANYENKAILTAGDEYQVVTVSKGKEQTVPVIASQDFCVVSQKGDNGEIEVKFECESKVKAPVEEGQVLGTIVVLKNGKIIGEVDAVAEHSVAVNSYRDVLKKINERWQFLAKPVIIIED